MILIVTASAAPATRVTDTGVLTTVHLVGIAVLAVLAVLAILWGARQKRIRAAGELEERRRAKALLEHPPVAASADAATAPPAPPLAREQAQAQGQVSDEPVARSAAPPPPPPAVATPEPAGYRLIDVKGLGPKAVPLLTALGIGDLAALAALDERRAAEVDGQLGALSGRMTRDRWVEQARLLDAGDTAAFEATFGKL